MAEDLLSTTTDDEGPITLLPCCTKLGIDIHDDNDNDNNKIITTSCSNDNDNDSDDANNIITSIHEKMPSLRARIESDYDDDDDDNNNNSNSNNNNNNLAVETHHDINTMDSEAIITDRFCSVSEATNSTRKIVKIDNSSTPRSGLMDGVRDDDDGDFEILPDDDDVDDDYDDDDINNRENTLEILERVEELNLDDDYHSDDDDIASPISPINDDADQILQTSFHSSSSTNRRRNRLTGLFAPKNPMSSPKSSQVISSGTNVNTNSDTTESVVEKIKPGQRLTTIIRKMGASLKEKSAEVSDMVDGALGEQEQDSSSDESSFDDDDKSWLEEESQMFDDDNIDQPIDCRNLNSSLPNSFLDLPPDIYDYLDSDIVKNIEEQDITTFAWEHHLYVKGLLQLLAERDLIGVEDDIFATDNISKRGVLRKKHGNIGWHVKYVELRKGNLTYFADVENEKRRTIHLRKRTCTCQVSTTREGGQEFIFELIVDGGRRLLWMTKSEEGCKGWVRAINQAMIGEVDDSRDFPLDATLYQTAIDDYQAVQTSLREVNTRQEYLVAMDTLLYRQTASSALRVPMKWIRDNVLEEEKSEQEQHITASERIKDTVREFWKNLCNTSVVLNGCLVEADNTYSGERVIGALSRCILEFDKVENTQDFEQIFNSLKQASKESKSFITELEAVSYSRTILNGALQSTSRGDIKAAVEELFRNDYVAYTILESSEPLHIDVSYAGDDFSENRPRPTELNAGWIETKSKKSKKWNMRYFMFSEGVLSHFQRADPRPYRLCSQMVLRDANITVLEGNMMSIELQGRKRLLRFGDRGELVRWKAIIEKDNIDVISDHGFDRLEEMQIDTNDEGQVTAPSNREDDCAYSLPRDSAVSEDIANGKTLKGVRGAGAKFLKNAARATKVQANKGMKMAKNSSEARMKSFRTGAGMLIRGVRGNTNSETSTGTMRRRPTNDMLISSTKKLNTMSEKREPTVQAVVEMNNTFKVMSKSNNSDEQQDKILL